MGRLGWLGPGVAGLAFSLALASCQSRPSDESAPGSIGCVTTLHTLGVSMDMYARDHGGKYPPNLEALTPQYLKLLPQCPEAGKTTYRVTVGAQAPGNTERRDEYYYIECHGDNHHANGLEANFPAYDSVTGLVEGP